MIKLNIHIQGVDWIRFNKVKLISNLTFSIVSDTIDWHNKWWVSI